MASIRSRYSIVPKGGCRLSEKDDAELKTSRTVPVPISGTVREVGVSI